LGPSEEKGGNTKVEKKKKGKREGVIDTEKKGKRSVGSEAGCEKKAGVSMIKNGSCMQEGRFYWRKNMKTDSPNAAGI